MLKKFNGNNSENWIPILGNALSFTCFIFINISCNGGINRNVTFFDRRKGLDLEAINFNEKPIAILKSNLIVPGIILVSMQIRQINHLGFL